MNKYLLLAFSLSLCHLLSAQNITISGEIDIKDGSPENSKVVIVKNGNKLDEQILNRKGHFNLKLSIGADYIVTFEKVGYISKNISVNTEIPEEILEANPNFPPTKLVITLLPHVENIDLSIFSQPIAIIAYDDEMDDFIFDEEYSDKIKDRIATIEQEIKLEASRLGKEKQNEQAVKPLIKPSDSLDKLKEAKEISYRKIIIIADNAFLSMDYKDALSIYRNALTIKPGEKYPQDMIDKIAQIIEIKRKQEAVEIDNKRIEEDRINRIKTKYDILLTEADKAFKEENFPLARLRYIEANNLNLGEEYPNKQLDAIAKIINSTQYKDKLAEYNTSKRLADKNREQEKYAAAKMYYQKALSILTIDKVEIEQQLIEIDKIIKTIQSAELEKAYKENIDKADKAKAEKTFSVARFYYQKALEIKGEDKYATDKLQEIEKQIKERQSK